MRFTLSSSLLSSKLTSLSKVISSKNSLSILGSFLFEIKDGQLTLTASDSDNMLRYVLELTNCDGEGSFCVPNKIMLSAVKELADQPVTFEVDTNDNSIRMVYQNGSYRITGQSADEYPVLSTISGPCTEAKLTAASLSQNIQRSLFAVSTDNIHMVMNGIYFDLREECLNVVASDGCKLVRNMLFTCNTELPASFILPQKPASLLRTVLSPEDESTVTLRFNEKNAEFVLPDGILTCLLIEGKFPNYKNVIPTDNPNVITIDRKSLISALKRILPFSNENTELVKLRLSQSNMEVLAEDADFATYAQEDIMCDYNGTPMTIGFKGTTLTDILNNLTGEDVVIELGDPSRAGVIRPCVQPEKEDVLMLIMPMLIND